MIRQILIATCFLVSFLFVAGEQSTKNVPVSLSQYLSMVSKGNISYIAEQFNVSMAEAQLKAAKVFADPEISFAYSNNQDQTMMMGQGIDAGISYQFSLGNKRGANISLATSQKELAQSALDAYFQNLRAEATLSFYTSVKQLNLFNVQKEIGEQLNKLAKADSLRLKAGSINAMDALQTALEARTQQNLVVQSEADFQASLVHLAGLQGEVSVDSLLLPSGSLPNQSRDFLLSDLIQSALKYRSDLQIAIRNKEISEKQMRLIHAKRAFEFTLDAGYAHSTVVKNEIAPAPAFNSYSAGVTIPLKFSALNKGEIQSARNAVTQSELMLKDVQLQITAEVTQAWILFKAAEKQMLHFQEGLISDAAKILDARLYAYQRGETGLIDLLNAQHKFGDLQIGYQESRYHYAEMLVMLEKTAGIWDIE
jgi:outer membrane protein, heavy metal efflux system